MNKDQMFELGHAPIGRLLLKFSLPSIALMLVNGVYNLIDRVYIGWGMGDLGIAAVTAGFPLMIIAMSLGLLFGVGATNLISIALGAGRKDQAERYLGQAFSVSAGLGVVAVVLSYLLMDPALRLFGANGEVLPLAREYMAAFIPGFLFQLPAMAIGNTLRAQGRPNAGMAATLVGVALNAALAPLFIFAFHWGLWGAGLATTIAQGLGLLLTIILIQDRKSTLRLLWRAMRLGGSELPRMIGIGLPVAVVNILSTITLVIANSTITTLGGANALAAIGIINTVSMFFGFPIMGIAQGAQAIIGYNFGAGNRDRVRRTLYHVILWSTVLSGICLFIIEAIPHTLVAVFHVGDPALAELTRQGLTVYMAAFVLFGLEMCAPQFFQAVGQAAPAAVLYVLRVVLQGASMIIMARVAGMNGFLLSGPLTDVIVSLVSLPMLWFGLSRLNVKLSLPAGGAPDGGQDDLLQEGEAEEEARSVRGTEA